MMYMSFNFGTLVFISTHLTTCRWKQTILPTYNTHLHINGAMKIFCRFKVVDDLSSRVAYGKTLADHAASRAARFTLYQDPVDSEVFSRENAVCIKPGEQTFLDKLMAEIPGL